MSGEPVHFRAVFGRQRDDKPAPRVSTPVPTEASTGPPVSRIARQLALGWKVRRLIDSGALRDQRGAAVRLGIVFPQMTHVLNLTYLAPGIQERILSGELVVAESRLRRVCRCGPWTKQDKALNL